MRQFLFALTFATVPCLAAAAEVTLAGLKSETPKEWKEEEPSNKMRMAQFKLPKAEGDKDDAELAIFVFPGGSGSVEANLKRQVAKFTPADGKDKVGETVTKTKVGEFEATYQDVTGTFIKKASPMAAQGTPMADYRQLYVIFEAKDGKQYYMNLIGPAKTIDKHKTAFDEWLKNFK